MKGVDFFMEKTEFVAILGGNGSGKSTLVKVMNGLLSPYQGEVEVLGCSPADHEQVIKIRKKLGMVFQNPENQIVCAIVEDDVAFSLENLGFPREEIKTRVEKALVMTGLTEKRFAQTADLSGGQMQRLAIAAILALHPEMIIFDESTSMLDQQGKEEIFNLILKLNEEGIGIIYITHFMEEAVYADRAVLMKNGSIAGSGKPCEIFNKPDLLKSCELDLPEAKELASEFSRRGVKIDCKEILTSDQLLEAVEKIRNR